MFASNGHDALDHLRAIGGVIAAVCSKNLDKGALGSDRRLVSLP
jgi:hypothetical protein